MEGPIDFATYDFLYSALLFMKTDGEENPEIQELTDAIIDCIEKTFNIQPKYYIRVCRDAVDLASDVKWDRFKQPPLEFKGSLKRKASEDKEDPSEKPPSKPLFEVFLEKKKAAKRDEAGDCVKSGTSQDDKQKSEDMPK